MKYRLISETVEIDRRSYDTYGISACSDNDGTVVTVYHDVSLDRQAVCRIIDILNDCEVELCHFEDVVNDEMGTV